MASDYMTTAEVAELLRTSPESVRFWRHVGKGPRSWKAGRRVLYDRRDVLAWIAAERERQGVGDRSVSRDSTRHP